VPAGAISTGCQRQWRFSATGGASGRPNESVSAQGYYNQDLTASATTTARNAAETNISGSGLGNANGRNSWSMPLSVAVGQCALRSTPILSFIQSWMQAPAPGPSRVEVSAFRSH